MIGEVSALAFASEAAALRVAELVQEACEAHLDLSRDEADAAAVAVEFASSQAQIVVTEQVQRAASTIFNALGASSTRKGLQLDRHWRNARTISSHNPVIYKSRIVGDWEINGTVPEFMWRAGDAPGTTSAGA
ncbi:monooxygenase, partial [Arthrobacter agilis]